MNLFKGKKKLKILTIGLLSYFVFVSIFVYFSSYHEASSKSIESAKESNSAVLVVFSGEGCPPCRRIAPYIDEIESEYGTYMKVIRVDINSEDGLHKKYDIKMIPTVILYYKGEVFAKLVGYHEKEVYLDYVEAMLIAKVLDVYAVMKRSEKKNDGQK